jgi:hypothetical protein
VTLFTKRMILSLLFTATTTGLCYMGKINGDAYGFTVLGILAGHHAADIVTAWRGNARATS